MSSMLKAAAIVTATALVFRILYFLERQKSIIGSVLSVDYVNYNFQVQDPRKHNFMCWSIATELLVIGCSS